MLLRIRQATRRQIKKVKRTASWIAVFGGAFALYKALLWFDEYWTRQEAPEVKEKIIVLGTGFAALSMVDTLDTTRFEVSVISPRDYFLFTPALADGAFGSADIESIVEPVRSFGDRTRSKFTFYEASCTNIDIEKNEITCSSPGKTFKLPYDYLVVAVGANNNTHGLSQESLRHTNFLNSINDARRIRNKMIDSFEAACLPGVTDEEKTKLLSFVVVGGGPIARKVAAQMSAFVKDKMIDTPELSPFVKITLVNYLDHIHNYYDHSISDYYSSYVAYNKNDVLDIDDDIIDIKPNVLVLQKPDGTQSIEPFSVCVWSTGLSPHPLVRQLASQFPKSQNHQKALIVSSGLQVLVLRTSPDFTDSQGTNNIYAVGSCSTIYSRGLRATYEEIFTKADTNGDERIQFDELTSACLEWGKTYPGLIEIQTRLRELFEAADLNHDGCLELSEFKEFMTMVDRSLTRFPDTAAVAIQQGSFLASQFNTGNHKKADNEDGPTFRYKHIGGYEYVGAEKGLRERGSKGEKIITGLGAQWMYENVFFSELIGMPMRIRLLFNSIIRFLSRNNTTRF